MIIYSDSDIDVTLSITNSCNVLHAMDIIDYSGTVIIEGHSESHPASIIDLVHLLGDASLHFTGKAIVSHGNADVVVSDDEGTGLHAKAMPHGEDDELPAYKVPDFKEGHEHLPHAHPEEHIDMGEVTESNVR